MQAWVPNAPTGMPRAKSLESSSEGHQNARTQTHRQSADVWILESLPKIAEIPRKKRDSCRVVSPAAKTCLAKLLGNHLQIVKLVARGSALASKKHQHTVVGLHLLPPEILGVIHLSSRRNVLRLAMTSLVAIADPLSVSDPIGLE